MTEPSSPAAYQPPDSAEMPSHGGPTRGADTTAWWPPSRMPLWWWVVSAVLVALVITAVWLVPVLVFAR